MSLRTRHLLLITGVLTLSAVSGSKTQVLPRPDPPYQGRIEIDPVASTPEWPKPVTAPEGAPNILVVMLDDVGFAATSTFGGVADTPTLDRLAAEGLRYNGFHVTPMCAPTRAALLSGRNAHQVGFGRIPELAAGYPGYNSVWPKNSAGIADVLRLNGYSTAAFGKWHNTPVWEVGPAGPFDRWPTGLGFEYFYGFIGYGTSQWEPNLYRNTDAVDRTTAPDAGHHLTTDLVNDAIAWVQRHEAVVPTKPFFLYFAPAATHSPHHVPKASADKFAGRFDAGWDRLRQETFTRQKALGVVPADAELTPRPAELPAWDSFTPAQQRLLARQMEVYAGFLAHTDAEVGRLLAAVRGLGHVNDTVVVYIADDNGPTAEGGHDGRDALTVEAQPQSVEERTSRSDALGSVAFDNAPAAGWAWAVNSPFKGAKGDAAHLGGTRAPLVVSWPGRIKGAGGLRSQFLHAVDIAPTLLELAGIPAPSVVNGVPQIPLEGTSFVDTFDHAEAPSRRSVQYFELFGTRGIYRDGWWAGSPNGSPWRGGPGGPAVPPEQRQWELYDLRRDFSQARDVAAQYPQQLEELKQLFDTEARRNQVYPLEPRFGPSPSVATGRTRFLYHAGVRRIPSASAPALAGRPHRITADILIPASGAEGVIVAQGGRHGGETLYIRNGRVTYETSAYGQMSGSIVAPDVLAPGRATVVVDVRPAGNAAGAPLGARRSIPMIARLVVEGRVAGESQVLMASSGETLDVGSDLVSPVSPKYTSPFAFTGTIVSVAIDLP